MTKPSTSRGKLPCVFLTLEISKGWVDEVLERHLNIQGISMNK
jgi:hypothetical protein